MAISIHNYRWRLALADGERKYDDLEKRLAESPVINVPTITLEGDANGAPHPEPSTYAKKFTGKYESGLNVGVLAPETEPAYAQIRAADGTTATRVLAPRADSAVARLTRLLEDLCGLAVDVEYASEWGTRSTANPRRPSVLVISQSGETSDTLAALRMAREAGEPTLAIANVPGSSMLREAAAAMPLGAGKELAIPATKSFTGQLTALYSARAL